MSRFFYRVRNTNGAILQNYISASNITDAALKLEQSGYIVLEIKEVETAASNKYNNLEYGKVSTLSLQEKKEFFNSFYYLYKSGLSIFEIFKSISGSSKNARIISLCRHVIRGVEKGKSLKEAMKNCSKALGLAYTTLISAGEEAGKLEENLFSILQNISREEKIKSNLISSLAYPVAIFFLAILVGLIFKFFVIEIFTQRTQGNIYVNIPLIAVTAIIKIFIIFAIILAVLFFIYKNRTIKDSIIHFILKLGIFKKLLTNYCFLNFFSVLSMAYESGIPIAEALRLGNSVINIPEINKKIQKAETMVDNGCETATALGVTRLFSDNDISQISSGEKAGELDKVFKVTAGNYANQLDTAISVISKLIEPIMIAIIAIFAAFILIYGYNAYYSSIFSMI